MFAAVDREWSFTGDSIVVWCESPADARSRVKNEYDKWAAIASAFGCQVARLLYPPYSSGRAYEVLATANPSMPVAENMLNQVYQSPKLPVSRSLMSVLERMVDSERPMFLLSNETDDQLWLNQLACDMIQSSGSDAVRRCMRNYWNAADLESLHQKMGHTSQSVRHNYRAILNDEQPDIWFEATSIYEPVEIADKSFRLSVNQDFRVLGKSDRFAVV